MGYHLGVDLGTTFTAAAVMNGGGPTMLGLGNRALQIPSVLYFHPDGSVLVGEAAELRSTSDPTRTVREFKRRIGDPVPILAAGRPYSAQAMTSRVLRWVLDKATEQMGEPPQDITLTYPANWANFKIDLLRQVATLADVTLARACSEPEAAALQYASRTKVAIGDRIAVYDLGGGTFDVCVLEKTDGGFRVLGRPEGIEHLGGIDFDEAVFRRVIDQLPPDAFESEAAAGTEEEEAAQMAALGRLRRDCVEAKEALSTDVEAVIPVALPRSRTSVRLTRGEFEDIIRPSIEETIGATRRALRSADTEPGRLSAMVLVGGSSRIPLVAELLANEFRCPIAIDTHPKNDVAMGAARAATLPAATSPLVTPNTSATQSAGDHARHRSSPEHTGAAGVSGRIALSTAAIPAEAQFDDALRRAAPGPPGRWPCPGGAEFDHQPRVEHGSDHRVTGPAGWLAEPTGRCTRNRTARRPALDRPAGPVIRPGRRGLRSGSHRRASSPNADRADRRCGGGPAGRDGRDRVDPARGQRRSGGGWNDVLTAGDANQLGPFVSRLLDCLVLGCFISPGVDGHGNCLRDRPSGLGGVAGQPVGGVADGGRRDRPVSGRHRDGGPGQQAHRPVRRSTGWRRSPRTGPR